MTAATYCWDSDDESCAINITIQYDLNYGQDTAFSQNEFVALHSSRKDTLKQDWKFYSD